MIILVAILSVAGCSSGPRQFAIKGEGDPVLNRDVTGRSLSVVVRLYQLKSANEFSKLTFDTLADGRPEEDLLKSELISKSDVVIVPGEVYSSTDKLSDEAKFLGIVGYFRNPDAHYWRYLLDADDVRSNGLVFRVEDCYIVLKNVKSQPIPGQPKDARPRCATSTLAPARSSQGQAPRSGQSGSRPAQQPAPAPAPASAPQKRGWLPQGMPEVTVNAAPKGVPITTQIGGSGSASVNIGSSASTAPQGASPFSGN